MINKETFDLHIDCSSVKNNNLLKVIKPSSLEASGHSSNNSHKGTSEINDLNEFIIDQDIIRDLDIIETNQENEEKGTKQYTTYTIRVITQYLDYSVNRRYREFNTLYNYVHLNHKQLQLPHFPQKKWFKSYTQDTIQKRKSLLTEFLKVMINSLHETRSYTFLNFLNISERFKKAGLENVCFSNPENLGLSQNILDTLSPLDSPSPKKKQIIIPKNEEEKMLRRFLKKLNQNEADRGKVFQKMEEYFFGKMHNLSQSMLEYLMLGDIESDFKGIIRSLICENHVGCINGFKFLRKALSFDYNSHAQVFQTIFCQINLKNFNFMMIHTHIIGNTQCKQDALFVLHQYIENNTNITPEFIEFMIGNEQAYQEYQRYRANQVVEYVVVKKHYNPTKDLESLESPGKVSLRDLTKYAPDADKLFDFCQNKQLKWKFVNQIDVLKIKHISGQLVKSTIKSPTTLIQTLQILEEYKSVVPDRVFSCLEIIDDQTKIIRSEQEYKSQFSKIITIFRQEVIYEVDKIIIKEVSLSSDDKHYKTIANEDRRGSYSYIFEVINQIEKNLKSYCKISIYYHMLDLLTQQSMMPVLLNETNIIQLVVHKMQKQIESFNN